ncbi:MAG: TatD family hydrolase [Bacteroidia bacterium]|nr:TatD family hydrolase [Bacteroidia bacterium]
MQIIDTHLHLYAEEFAPDRNALIAAAKADGVVQMLLPNIDHRSLPGLKKLADEYPGYCLPMMGLHPCYVKENFEEELALVEMELRSGKYIAVGEIGMDRYWDLDHITQQEEALRRQLRLAHALDLPVALHTRNANEEVMALIRSLKLSGLRGVFHCFSGSLDQAREMIDMGFYLGIGGVLTYKNGGVDKVIAEIDPQHIVLETDGPYLSPVPHRGKRNQPAYIKYIAEKFADIKNLSPEEAGRITSENARKLFRL